jgi:hypothetical protein
MPFTKNALETYWNLNLGQNGSLEDSNISKADNKAIHCPPPAQLGLL